MFNGKNEKLTMYVGIGILISLTLVIVGCTVEYKEFYLAWPGFILLLVSLLNILNYTAFDDSENDKLDLKKCKIENGRTFTFNQKMKVKKIGYILSVALPLVLSLIASITSIKTLQQAQNPNIWVLSLLTTAILSSSLIPLGMYFIHNMRKGYELLPLIDMIITIPCYLLMVLVAVIVRSANTESLASLPLYVTIFSAVLFIVVSLICGVMYGKNYVEKGGVKKINYEENTHGDKRQKIRPKDRAIVKKIVRDYVKQFNVELKPIGAVGKAKLYGESNVFAKIDFHKASINIVCQCDFYYSVDGSTLSSVDIDNIERLEGNAMSNFYTYTAKFDSYQVTQKIGYALFDEHKKDSDFTYYYNIDSEVYARKKFY